MLLAYTGLAEVYDALMQDVDGDAWAAYIETHLHKSAQPVKTVLDCACGTGAIALRLAKKGYEVTGLDCSAEMLHVAQQSARNAGLRVPFVQQDMRQIALHRKVDAIVCACDGVNYLLSEQDVQAFFKSAHAALKSQGLLLFDISSRYKLRHILADNTFAEALDDCAYIWQNSYEEETALSDMQFSGFVRRGACYERFDEAHTQRGHSVEEITAWLTACGFVDIEAYGAFTMQPPEEQAERIQFFARAE